MEAVGLARQVIAEARLSRIGLTQRQRLIWFVVGLLIALAVAAIYQLWLSSGTDRRAALPDGSALGSLLVACLAFLFGYYQWTDGRREASLETFYERLRLTNERLIQWPEARRLIGSTDADADFNKRMYVYGELDDLEYMLERYKLGYVRESLLDRTFRTFKLRCGGSEEFRRLAREQVAKAGYNADTAATVDVLSR